MVDVANPLDPEQALNAIQAHLEGIHDEASTSSVTRNQVRKWAQSNDLEVLGATYALITDPEAVRTIQPSLTFEDYHLFVLRFFERCIREDPDGIWASTRYEAARDLGKWITLLWADPTAPRSALVEIKTWLESLLASEDKNIQLCLVNGALEHVFAEEEVAEFFSDWKESESLRNWFQLAIDGVR